eukprot:TRINITY_DN19080_c0_g1_i1.p2 TRINITY_DN19080_c0_g1~~TRINITY_DN19080_c0_g1_i1.p2  ORF type:complete len:201 (-),score=89.82 TRINITY_DN19080_c0_g1_i1:55-657(-)
MLGLKLLFALMDYNNNQFIDAAALQGYAGEQNDFAQAREVDACIEAVDVDGDGKIGLMDFLCFAARLKLFYEIANSQHAEGEGTAEQRAAKSADAPAPSAAAPAAAHAAQADAPSSATAAEVPPELPPPPPSQATAAAAPHASITHTSTSSDQGDMAPVDLPSLAAAAAPPSPPPSPPPPARAVPFPTEDSFDDSIVETE